MLFVIDMVKCIASDVVLLAGYEGDAAFYDVFGIEGFSERFNNSETEGKYELFKQYFTVENRSKTMTDFARLNVYIADSNVVKTQETADYTRNQLVSDIGKIEYITFIIHM